jgi:hypothetical protein
VHLPDKSRQELVLSVSQVDAVIDSLPPLSMLRSAVSLKVREVGESCGELIRPLHDALRILCSSVTLPLSLQFV